MSARSDWHLLNLRETLRPELTEGVRNFWREQTGLAMAEIERRAGQLLMVALSDGDEPVGVCTAYLETPERLRVPVWTYRTLIAPPYRQRSLARDMLIASFEWLERRFTEGHDTQARGLYMQIENPVINRHRNETVWPRSRMAFVGVTAEGCVCRVRYFRGARVD